GKRAAQPRKPAAESEGEGEDAVHIDADPARHSLIVDGRTDLRAEPGALDRRNQDKGDRERHADQEQTVKPEPLSCDGNAAAQVGRKRDRLLNGAVNIGSDGNRDEYDPDRKKALIKIARPIKAAEKDALDEHAGSRRRCEGERQGRKERPPDVV